jgi:hypothetical protein
MNSCRLVLLATLVSRVARASLVALAVLVVMGASEATARRSHDRGGFYIGFGLGVGAAGWDWAFESEDDPGEGSGVLHFRIGGAIRDDLTLGFESSSWVKDWDLVALGLDLGDAKANFNAATLAVTWFPGNVGFFMKGGVGIATARGEVEFLSIDETDKGVAVLGAAGYEWRLTDKFALGPEVEVFFLGIDGDLVKDVVVVDGAMEFTWYW